MSALAGGALVVSLDFELYWGVRDLWPIDAYRANLLGVRAAIPALLRLFEEFDVHATWATVGLLLCESRAEMLAALPARRPAYADPGLSPYAEMAAVGNGEDDDPFHYAPSLVHRIAATPHQEIGTHTLSHYYCLEAGQSVEDFRADLDAACGLMQAKLGRAPESIVFPRNQTSAPYVAECARRGLVAYRGNQDHWAHRARRRAAESSARRAFRLADAYVPLARQRRGRAPAAHQGAMDVPATRYLRPYAPSLRRLEPLRLRRIVGELERAAATGRIAHLWWHPHDFGVHLDENLAFLRRVLVAFARLRATRGMASLTMAEAARRLASVEARGPGRDAAIVVRHFDGAAGYWRDVYADTDVQAAIYRERQAAALDAIARATAPPAAPVLEVGCGGGALAVALARRGHAVAAVDRVPAMIAVTRAAAGATGVAGAVYTSVADAGALPFADGGFGVVVALGVLPWVTDPAGTLAEIRRVLRPGGWAILSVDQRWRLTHVLDPRWFPALAPLRRRGREMVARLRRRPPRIRHHAHGRRELDRLLAATGLEHVEGRTLGFGPFTFLGRELLSRPRAVALHRRLQRLADGGVPVLRAAGAQYLVVARRPTERAAVIELAPLRRQA